MSSRRGALLAGGPWESWRLRAPVILVLVLLGYRLLSLGAYPLMDTSEARYGEIARVMVQTGDWVTPQETPGTPFWAKPPLSTWLSAASIQVFGVNEFAVRLPAWLCALAVLWMTGLWTRALTDAPDGGRTWLARACLMAGAGFFAAAGAVMTDPCLVVCTCAMQLAFHQAVIRARPGAVWRWGFFAAAGLGMLAKGPVIAVFVGGPILVWAVWTRQVVATWRALPWVRGALLALALCAPWYLLAERHTPGFLTYFLLGEHIMRFIKPGWGGDLYGTAHAEPTGTIWLYLAAALGAQCLLLGLAWRAQWRAARDTGNPLPGSERDGLRLALCNLLFPVAFFTFAGNIIWTYVLPALPAAAVLTADGLSRVWKHQNRLAALVFACLAFNLIVLVGAFTFWVPGHVRSHSSRDLLANPQVQQALQAGPVLYLGRKAPASLRFYAGGKVLALRDEPELFAHLRQSPVTLVAVAADSADSDRQRWLALHPAWQVQVLAANTDLTLLEVRAPLP